MRLVADVFKELAEEHQAASAANDPVRIAKVSEGFEALLCDVPEDPGVLFSFASTRMQLGSFGVAVNLLQRVIEMEPDNPLVWNNLGSAWKGHNFDVKAGECWEKANAIYEGKEADVLSNLASLYINKGDPTLGLEYAEQSLALKPDLMRTRWNYSLLLLEAGRWEEGLENYEAGLLSNDRLLRFFDEDKTKVPFWEGPHQKGTVVFYAEQGMGDEIMWVSCMAEMRDLPDIRVVFDCHPRMVKLFKRCFGIECFGTRKNFDLGWMKNIKVDYKMPLGSIFHHFRPTGDFPKKTYLTPNKTLVNRYLKKLEALGPGPYVGIAWEAGTVKTRTDFRSIKVVELKPIFEQGGTFISMQYSEGAAEKCERVLKDHDIRIHHWPDVVEAGPKDHRYLGYNFDHTIALAAALDLIIVPNTTLVHVCGAIGQECWTLTPKGCAWRYGLEGVEMPMYGPWVKQFRNGMAKVAEAYAKWRSQLSDMDPPCSKTNTDETSIAMISSSG